MTESKQLQVIGISEIQKVKVEEYGLEVIKAKAIKAMFQPMLNKMEALEGEFNNVIKLEMSVETSALAKELRLKYVKVRTGTAEIHQTGKASVLLEGRVWDGWKNAQLKSAEGIESALMSIEKYVENLEKERIEKLQEKRGSELSKYIDEDTLIPIALGELTEDVWNNFLTGTKVNYELRIEAEKKAEADRIAKEKAEAKERERIRVENKRLKKEAIKRDKLEKIESDKRAKIEAARIAKEEAQRKVRENFDREVRERHEAKLREAEKKAQARLDQERKEKEIIESTLKAKAEKERAELLKSVDATIIKAITHGYEVATTMTLDEAIESWVEKQGEKS